MTPEELSRRLRLLADGIDSADRPSVARVAAEMRTLMRQVEDAALPARHGPDGRRRLPAGAAPARAAPVDVTDDRAFRAALGRTASSAPQVHDYRA